MKRILAAAGMALVFGVTLSAQSTSPAQSEQSAKKSQSKMSSASSVTLTGCLREGDTPDTYVLANVDPSELRGRSGSQSGTSSGTSSGTGSSTGSGTGTSAGRSSGTSGAGDESTVELIGGKNLDLKSHVGHRVQITGTMAAHGKEKSKTTGTTGSATGEAQTDTTSRSGRSGAGDDKHRVNVRAMKHISETCSM